MQPSGLEINLPTAPKRTWAGWEAAVRACPSAPGAGRGCWLQLVKFIILKHPQPASDGLGAHLPPFSHFAV